MKFYEVFSGVMKKFAESFGSGLAFGIVTVAALIIMKFVITDEIARLSDVTNKCAAESTSGHCVARASCTPKKEIAVGGQCIISKADIRVCGAFSLQNAGLDDDVSRFQCVWNYNGNGCSENDFQISVRAACVKTRSFGLTISHE